MRTQANSSPNRNPFTQADGSRARILDRLDTGGRDISDRLFREAVPDDAAAEQLFAEIFWPGDDMRCLRCAWTERAKPSGNSAGLPYWCPRCRKTFSIRTDTVMYGSHITLRKWAQALHLWTGGSLPSSSEELSRRLGLSGRSAHYLTRCILTAAQEDLPPLREPAELACFTLGGNPKFRRKSERGKSADHTSVNARSVNAIALAGRDSGRTFIGTVPGRTRVPIEEFVDQHLERDAELFLSNQSVNQGWAKKRGRTYLLRAPESSYLLLDLRERTRTWMVKVHNWVTPQYMAEYLAGWQWWENHRDLSHRERMVRLAEGMLWKKPPKQPSNRRRALANKRP